MIEIEKEKFDRSLAEKFDVSYDELLELDYEICTEASDDGDIYGHFLKFKENAPKGILEKIRGLEDENRVWLDQLEFDDNDDI